MSEGVEDMEDIEVGAVATVIRGVTYEKSQSSGVAGPGLVPLLRATNIGLALDFNDLVYVPETLVNGQQLLRPGDIVLAASSGSLSVVGKAAPLRNPWRGTFGAFCFALRPNNSAVRPLFLSYYLQTSAYRAAVSRLAAGVNINNLRREHVEGMRLPLMPMRVQDRVVAAIENYLARLDDAVFTLERAQRNLKRYRASVLKAAVEGRLVPTEAELARAEKRDYEPASKLLERILVERRRRWEEAELAKMKASGKVPKDDRWKAKYEEPAGPDTRELPELPEGWCWATIDQIGQVSGGLTQNAKRNALPLKFPFLRVANVYANELRLGDVEQIGVDENEIRRALLMPGDLLVVEGNGSPEQIGRVALWDGSITDCLHQNHLIKVRFDPLSLSSWSMIWLLSPAGRTHVRRVASSTSGLHTLSISKIAALPVPLCPLAEQDRIRAETDRALSLAGANESTVQIDLKRCARLRQSILKWAFEGKLADQDPSDEPASVLLERIRAERAAQDTKSSPRKPGRPAKRS